MGTSFISTVLPLAGDGGMWAAKFFAAARQAALARSGAVTSLAMALACFFVGIRFVRMYYDVVSDEQHGGFGGIRTWDILRPVLIILLISGFQTFFIGPLDSLSQTIAGGMSSDRTLGDVWAEYKAENKRADEEKEKAMRKAAAERTYNMDPIGVQKGVDGLTDKISLWVDKKIDHLNRFWTYGGEAAGVALDNIVVWLFNIIFVIMMGFSDILLCVMAVLGPIVLAFSIFDHWRNNVWTYIGQYITLTMWKPVGAAIVWATVTARQGISSWLAGSVGGITGLAKAGTILAGIGIITLVVIAGIKCLRSIPSIASSVLSLASPPDAGAGGITAGMAGGAVGAAAQMAGGAAGGALKVAGAVVPGAAGRGLASAGSAVGSAIGKVGGAVGKMF